MHLPAPSSSSIDLPVTIIKHRYGVSLHCISRLPNLTSALPPHYLLTLTFSSCPPVMDITQNTAMDTAPAASTSIWPSWVSRFVRWNTGAVEQTQPVQSVEPTQPAQSQHAQPTTRTTRKRRHDGSNASSDAADTATKHTRPNSLL